MAFKCHALGIRLALVAAMSLITLKRKVLTMKASKNVATSNPEATFKAEASGAVANAEFGALMIGKKAARAKLSSDGLEEAKRLGVDPAHAQAIIDQVLKQFDQETVADEDQDVEPIALTA